MLKKLVVALEWILFGSLLGISASGDGDGLLSALPFSFEITASIPSIAILLFALLKIRQPDWNLSITTSFALAAVSFSARYFSVSGSPDTFTTTIPMLYFFVIVASGLMGKKFTWILPFFCLLAAELSHLAFINYEKGIEAMLSVLSEYAFASAYAFAPLFAAGLFTSILSPGSLIKDIRQEIPPQRKPQKSGMPQDEDLNGSEDYDNLTRTRMFTIDRNSGLIHSEENDVQDLLYSVVYFMSRNFKAYSALAFIYDPVNRVFVLNSYQSRSMNIIKGVSIPLGRGVVGRIGSEKRSFMSGNFSNYNSETLYYSDNVEINSILAVPIISDKDELLGVLVLDSLDKLAFKDQDKETLHRFSGLAAALISNARMRIFQERMANTFKTFYQTSHHFTTALKVNDVFDVLFRMIPMVTPCTRQIAIIYDMEKKCAVISRIDGEGNDIHEGMEFNLNSGIYSYALQKRKLINIQDFRLYESKYYRFMPDEIPNPYLRSLIIFPITDDESRCRGLFSVESSIPDQFSGEIEQVMATIVENASVAFTRALLYQQMERLATTDGLTELVNHRHFQEILSKEIERSRRYKRPLSLLLMDIDHFKSFNDTYGHPVGDLVLKEISACIRRSIRINDVAARYGGEEFTVIIPETAEQGALVTAERIRTTIENHIIRSLDRELRVTVSIGCATFPSLASSQQELIDNADKALYFSKEHGRNQVNIFNPGMKGKEKK